MSVLLAAPILLTLTLLVSGIAKLGSRRRLEDAMVSLRLPLRGVHPVAAAALPMVEIVLAVVIWVPVVWLQVIVAGVTAALMTAYLVVIARALTFDETVECACFGTLASPTVSRATLHRNVALTVLGVLGVVAAGSGAIARAVLTSPLELLGWIIAFAMAVLLTALALGGTHADADSAAASPSSGTVDDQDGEDEELLDYERRVFPFGVVQEADGTRVTLRDLTESRAVLLVMVSQGCGPCMRVLGHVPEWSRQLEPMLHVRTVFTQRVDALREETRAKAGSAPSHDVERNLQRAFDIGGTPAAVLLGADGLLAGGPVSGGDAVVEFVEEITAQLRELA